MKISIALCTFNGQKFLPDLLESIWNQTLEPDEVVICDDGSTDGSLQILNNFAINAGFEVRIYSNEEQLGSTKNFEKAIKLCQGDIIFLCDQDDVWLKDKVYKLVQEFTKDDSAGVVFSNGHVVDENLKSLGYSLWDAVQFEYKNFKSETVAFETLLNHNVVTGATMAFRRDKIDFAIPIPSDWVHDEWIAILLSASCKLKFINESLIHYRQHESNQIGATQKSFSANFNTAQCNNVEVYYGKYIKLKNKLNEMKDEIINKKIIEEVEKKLLHLSVRSNLSKNTVKRIWQVTFELVNLGYHRYSNGFYSAAKDLLYK